MAGPGEAGRNMNAAEESGEGKGIQVISRFLKEFQARNMNIAEVIRARKNAV